MKSLTKVVIGVLIYCVLFVVFAWVTYWVKGSVPDSLIQYGLGSSTIELMATALIKIFKEKSNERSNSQDSGASGEDSSDLVFYNLDSLLEEESSEHTADECSTESSVCSTAGAVG